MHVILAILEGDDDDDNNNNNPQHKVDRKYLWIWSSQVL